MDVEFDEGVVGSDHGQPRGGDSEVEPKADQLFRETDKLALWKASDRPMNGGKKRPSVTLQRAVTPVRGPG